MTEAGRREPLTLTRLATELGEVEQLLIELAGRLSSLKEYVEIARSRKPTVLAHESKPNNESLGTPLTNQTIQRESSSGNESKNSFNFGPLPSIQWKTYGVRKKFFDHVTFSYAAERQSLAQVIDRRAQILRAENSARIAAPMSVAPKRKVPNNAKACTVDPIDWRNI
jgi:hypothetical protein